jgi:threonylcarbamoyladenosine tRNA methylthiotransferase MtaB
MTRIETQQFAPRVVTFGCRLNAYESEIIREKAIAAGLHDAIIVNTCAVTSEAVRQARQSIRKLRRENPQARLLVTGCAAQTEPQLFAEMSEVDGVLGNAEKLTTRAYAGAFGAEASERVRVSDIMDLRETGEHLIQGFEDRARAFVQVQNGCDHRCTFCIIPFGRGPSRSVPAGAVVKQVEALVAKELNEIVLTGVDLTAYGADLPGRPSLGRLVEQILRHAPQLKRLRLSSIDVAECDERLFELLASERRVMPHVHLSLQSGDDMILKRMKRRHTRAQAIAFCERLHARRANIAFGADLIAGFPTEDEAMASNTLNLVEDCGLTWLHVFPFSPRKGTPAARIPQVNGGVAKSRAAALRSAGNAAIRRHLESNLGQSLDVLIEGEKMGRTETYASVALQASAPIGSIMTMHIQSHDGERLIAGMN